MLLSNDKFKLARNLINTSPDTIHIYQESVGDIRTFYHSQKKLPSSPNEDHTYYVVDEDTYNSIKETNRNLTDIAVIFYQSTGRNGITITYLRWGENPTIPVRLFQALRTYSA